MFRSCHVSVSIFVFRSAPATSPQGFSKVFLKRANRSACSLMFFGSTSNFFSFHVRRKSVVRSCLLRACAQVLDKVDPASRTKLREAVGEDKIHQILNGATWSRPGNLRLEFVSDCAIAGLQIAFGTRRPPAAQSQITWTLQLGRMQHFAQASILAELHCVMLCRSCAEDLSGPSCKDDSGMGKRLEGNGPGRASLLCHLRMGHGVGVG